MPVVLVCRNGSVYRKTALSNGLRVITERVPSARSISLGVWVDVGARHEQPAENGVSHLIEHMVFKGTKRRNARQIAASLESLGGALNAFTSREQTCFTARVLDEHLPMAVDVLADITCRATFTPTNLEREKHVICEEIKESFENPADHIHDVFAEAFWGGHPLGQPILGSETIIKRMSRRRILGYLRTHYRPPAVVVAAAGSVSHNKLVHLSRELFQLAPGQAVNLMPPAKHLTEPLVEVSARDIEQVHACLGFPGMPFGGNERFPLLALVTHLGSGMSSVLFQLVRERYGLVYTIYTFHDAYRDAGMLTTYLATDRSNLARSLQLVLREIRRVKKNRLSATRLRQVKQQLKGQLALGMESTTAKMNRLARQELMLGEYVPLEKTLRAIDGVTASQVLESANQLLDENRLVVAALGAVDRKTVGNSLSL